MIRAGAIQAIVPGFALSRKQATAEEDALFVGGQSCALLAINPDSTHCPVARVSSCQSSSITTATFRKSRLHC